MYLASGVFCTVSLGAAISLGSCNTTKFSPLDSGGLGLVHYHAHVVCLCVPV